MIHFNKRYHPPGTEPGTLERPLQESQAPASLSLTVYDDHAFSETPLTTVDDGVPVALPGKVVWLHVQGTPGPDVLRRLGTQFGLHPLALEDVINTGQRPKLEQYAEHLFTVLSMPSRHPGPGVGSTEQVSFFLGPQALVSFHSGTGDPFGPVRSRLRERVGKLRRHGADYLLYALVDLVIDESFPVLERFGDEVEALENELLENPTRETLHRLQRLKRTLLLLRRMLWPQREVINGLIRDESGVVQDETKIYFRDCYDHTVQIMDLIEMYRDVATSMVDIYLSSVSNRLNETMRVLTLIATIFIPLTFVVGVYGMNFANPDSPWAMPELHWYYGYPLVWLVMVLVVAGMLIYFKRKGWF